MPIVENANSGDALEHQLEWLFSDTSPSETVDSIKRRRTSVVATAPQNQAPSPASLPKSSGEHPIGHKRLAPPSRLVGPMSVFVLSILLLLGQGANAGFVALTTPLATPTNALAADWGDPAATLLRPPAAASRSRQAPTLREASTSPTATANSESPPSTEVDPTSTRIPIPTASPVDPTQPTFTITPSSTLKPSPTVAPTSSPEPSATLQYTPTSIPDPSPTASTNPEPTPTRVPTDTPTQANPNSSFPTRLVIPSINLEAPIVRAGIRKLVIDGQAANTWAVPAYFAAGWHHTSAQPGQVGNTVLNGHQFENGGVFRDLSALQPDDEIIVYTGSAAYHYRVAENHTLVEEGLPLAVRAQNAHWILPSTDERLTLVTCAPEGKSTHRLIVVAFPATASGGATPGPP